MAGTIVILLLAHSMQNPVCEQRRAARGHLLQGQLRTFRSTAAMATGVPAAAMAVTAHSPGIEMRSHVLHNNAHTFQCSLVLQKSVRKRTCSLVHLGLPPRGYIYACTSHVPDSTFLCSSHVAISSNNQVLCCPG